MIELLNEMSNSNYSQWVLKYVSNWLIWRSDKLQLFIDFIKGAFEFDRTQINLSSISCRPYSETNGK